MRLAFSHAQQHWNVGLHTAQVYNAINPMNALTHVIHLAFYTHPLDWPRLWEAALHHLAADHAPDPGRPLSFF